MGALGVVCESETATSTFSLVDIGEFSAVKALLAASRPCASLVAVKTATKIEKAINYSWK